MGHGQGQAMLQPERPYRRHQRVQSLRGKQRALLSEQRLNNKALGLENTLMHRNIQAPVVLNDLRG